MNYCATTDWALKCNLPIAQVKIATKETVSKSISLLTVITVTKAFVYLSTACIAIYVLAK